MKRHVHVAALALVAFAPLVAQTPQGWKMRVDKSTSASDPDAPGDIKFVTMGSGFHATNPQAAVYWNPANTASGAYTLKGTFTLMKPSGHTNYYGLVFGGSDLEGAQQSYLYFVVAQDGTWLIKRRDGDATASTVVAKTPNDAVKKPDTGKIHQRPGSARRRRQGRFRRQRHGRALDAEGRIEDRRHLRHPHQSPLLEVHIDGLAVSK